MPSFVGDTYEAVKPNAPCGCINGGGLYDGRTGKYIWNCELPRSGLELAEYAAEKIPDISVQVNTFDTVYFCRENSCMEWFRDITGLPKISCGIRDVNEPVAKVLFGDFNTENITRLSELLASHPRASEFQFIRSDSMLYEILPKGVSKATVLPKLAEYMNVSMSRTVAVGDYYNDIKMIQTAALGIAVANAPDEVKAAADHVTVSNNEHAIAQIIHGLAVGTLKV